jgi:16S rRNA (guanine966-N2)-methyltransferase
MSYDSPFLVHCSSLVFADSSHTPVASARFVPMRIIAGEFRGRRLLPPTGDATRPITDRVKQSLFDIITPLIPDANVYDCFAGTGSMGLECLSRGAKQATFFEVDRSAQQRLKENIQTLGVSNQTTVIGTDLFQWFRKSAPPTERAGLIFLDPPYRFLRERQDDLMELSKAMTQHLSPNGTIIFRHDAADEMQFPSLRATDTRTYGSMTLEFLTSDP